MTRHNCAATMKFVIIFYITGLISCSQASSNTLQAVHAFFRHGARTPELKDVYVTDPHKENGFYPMGYGALTNKGKQESYRLGRKFRELYNDFLGDVYLPEMVEATTTDFDRTKMTLILVLAGLFPPSKLQLWNKDLQWMPIPYQFDKDSTDFSLRRPTNYCPTYIKAFQELMASPEVQSHDLAKKDLFEYVQNHTKKTIKNSYDVFGIYQTLTAEKGMNLTLPQWTHSVYPDKIEPIAEQLTYWENLTPTLKRLNGGRMLSKVIKHMVDISNGKQKEKIFLYSGHENNVINILAALNLFKPHVPKYASSVIIELHYLEATKTYAVKVLYLRDAEKDPEVQKLEGCDILCPLNSFITIAEPHIPVNYTEECQSKIYLD